MFFNPRNIKLEHLKYSCDEESRRSQIRDKVLKLLCTRMKTERKERRDKTFGRTVIDNVSGRKRKYGHVH
eukprot:scaffold1487_cov143-Ochromonas_danica.AAC.4